VNLLEEDNGFSKSSERRSDWSSLSLYIAGSAKSWGWRLWNRLSGRDNNCITTPEPGPEPRTFDR